MSKTGPRIRKHQSFYCPGRGGTLQEYFRTKSSCFEFHVPTVTQVETMWLLGSWWQLCTVLISMHYHSCPGPGPHPCQGKTEPPSNRVWEFLLVWDPRSRAWVHLFWKAGITDRRPIWHTALVSLLSWKRLGIWENEWLSSEVPGKAQQLSLRVYSNPRASFQVILQYVQSECICFRGKKS